MTSGISEHAMACAAMIKKAWLTGHEFDLQELPYPNVHPNQPHFAGVSGCHEV
jgi:hypothetical protein